MRTNYYKVAWLALATVLGLALVAAVGVGAARGFQAYSYLNATIGEVGGKPITRANYLDLQLAREAQAQAKAPALPEGK